MADLLDQFALPDNSKTLSVAKPH